MSYYPQQQQYHPQHQGQQFAQRSTYNSYASGVSQPQTQASFYPNQPQQVYTGAPQGIPINNNSYNSDLYYGEESSFNVDPVRRRGQLCVNNPINTNLLDQNRHAFKNTPNYQKSILRKYRSPLETDTGCI